MPKPKKPILSEIVKKHVGENLGYYQKLPSEEASFRITSALRKANLNITRNNIRQIILRLRRKGILPQASNLSIAEAAKALRKVRVELGVPLKKDVVRQTVQNLLEQGVKGSEITPDDVYNALKGNSNIKFEDCANALGKIRKNGELDFYSKEALARSRNMSAKRGAITLRRKAITPNIRGYRATRIRAFIDGLLALGFDPKEFTPNNIYQELKDKVEGIKDNDVWYVLHDLRGERGGNRVLPELNLEEKLMIRYFGAKGKIIMGHIVQNLDYYKSLSFTDVTSEIYAQILQNNPNITKDNVKNVVCRLRKAGFLPKIPREPISERASEVQEIKISDLEKIPLDRREKLKKLLEERQRSKKVDEIILDLRKYFPELKGVGDEDLFYNILRYLLRGTKPNSIVLLMQEKGFNIDLFDVACVSNHFALMLEKIGDCLKTKVRETLFWDTFLPCREILKKYSNRLNREINLLIPKKLKNLGRSV